MSKIPDSELEFVKRCYYEKLETFDEIGKRYGASISSVWRYFNKHELTRRTMEETHRHVKLNTNYFETVDSHEKAQILGLIAADGCVTDYGKKHSCGDYLMVALQETDREYLNEIRIRLGYERALKYVLKDANSQNQYLLKIGSNKLVRDLKRLGIEPRKSFTISFPTENQVREDFLSSYVLGFFEGDGTIFHYLARNKYKNTDVAFVGPEVFLKDLKTYLERHGVLCGKIIKDRMVFKLRLLKESILQFMDLIYANAAFKMKRKFDKFQEYRQRKSIRL